MHMSPVVYPSTLPAPEAYSLTPAARALLPSLDGAKIGRARLLDKVGTADVSWFFDLDKYDIWAAWYVAQTLKGQRLASIPLPGRGGMTPRICRFLAPVAVSYEAGLGYRVVAKLQVTPFVATSGYGSYGGEGTGAAPGDTTAPGLFSAEAIGSALTLTYTETGSGMASTAPAVGDYAVTIAGAARAVSAVAINPAARTITLTLSGAAVAYGQAVAISYTPGASPVQDMAGNLAGALTARLVTNLTPAPLLFSSSSAAGNLIVLQYPVALSGAALDTPQVGDFYLRTSSPVAALGVSIHGPLGRVYIRTHSATWYGATVRLGYTPGAQRLRAAAGGDASAFSPETYLTKTDPAGDWQIASAIAVGSSVYLGFNGAGIFSGSNLSPLKWAVIAGGVGIAVTSITTNNQNTTLNLASPVAAGVAVTVSYTPPGAHDNGYTQLPGFTAFPVVNGNPVA